MCPRDHPADSLPVQAPYNINHNNSINRINYEHFTKKLTDTLKTKDVTQVGGYNGYNKSAERTTKMQ